MCFNQSHILQAMVKIKVFSSVEADSQLESQVTVLCLHTDIEEKPVRGVD